MLTCEEANTTITSQMVCEYHRSFECFLRFSRRLLELTTAFSANALSEVDTAITPSESLRFFTRFRFGDASCAFFCRGCFEPLRLSARADFWAAAATRDLERERDIEH